MKKIIVTCLLSVLVIAAANAQYGTARTGYEGDYFSLEGALDLFKQSYSLDDFERKLNTEENWVNNLDLNYDGRIDYIRVEHRRQGNFHAVILQALVDRYDIQDVAVLEIEIIGPREAVLQIVGDEDLYGREVIVEPIEGYSDNRTGYVPNYGTFVNVYYWRTVQDILRPQYTVYVSPFYWQYYPVWWRPWIQCSWNVFRPRVVIYTRYYQVVHVHRVIRVHHFYQPYRSYSYPVVQRSNRVRIEQGRAPIYRPEPVRRPVEERSVVAPRSSAPREGSSVNRERTPAPADRRATENRPSRSSAATRPPSYSRRPSTGDNPAPSVQPRSERSTSPSVRTPAREQTPRPSVTPRSTTPQRNSPAPSVQPRSERSTSPSVRTPAREQTPRSDKSKSSTKPGRGS